MASKDEERVLCVPTEAVNGIGHFQGFKPDASIYLDALLKPGLARFVRRGDCETDPSLKQIIPYVVFLTDSEVFTYTRGKSQGESRLHALRSLGVGGHVAEEDAAGGCTRDAYELALKRELDEEVRVSSPGLMRTVGLINDDSTPVGQVHLGVVHICMIESPNVEPLEAGLAEATFMPIESAHGLAGQFETWSQICLENLPELKLRSKPE